MKSLFQIALFLCWLGLSGPALAQDQNPQPLKKWDWNQLTEDEKKNLLARSRHLVGQKPRGVVEKVFIPYSEWQEFLQKHRQMILIKYRDFLDLVAKARANRISPKTTLPSDPGAWPLRHLTLRGVVDGSRIQWLGEYEIYAPRPRKVDLTFRTGSGSLSAQLGKAWLDGKPAPLEVVAKHRYRLHLSQPGRHRLKIKFSSPLTTQGTRARGEIVIPPAPAAQLHLVLPGRKGITLPGALVRTTYRDKSKSTLVTGSISGQKKIAFSYQRTIRRRNEKKPVSWVTSREVIRLGQGLVQRKVSLKYRPYRGRLNELEILIPQGYSITSAPNLGSIEKRWQMATGKGNRPHRLQIYLAAARKKPFTCQFTLVGPLEEKLTIEPIDSQQQGQQGTIALSVVPGWRLAKVSHRHLKPLTINDKKTRKSSPFPWWGAYRYTSLPYQLQLEMKPIHPRFTAHLRTLVGWKDNQVQTRLAGVLEVTQGRLNRTRIALPDQGEPVLIKMRPKGRYQYDPTRRELTFFPDRPLAKGKHLYIQIETVASSPKVLDLPQWTVPEADQVLTYLAVSTSSEYRLRPGKIKHLRPIELGTTSKYGLVDDRIQLAYRAIGPYQGQVTRQSQTSHLTARWNSLVTLQNRRCRITSQVTFTVENAPHQRFLLAVPEEVADQVDVYAPKSDVRVRDNGHIEITTSSPRRGEVTFALRYRMDLPSKEFTPPLPYARKVGSQRGTMALEVPDNVKIQVRPTDEIQPMDTREVPLVQGQSQPFYACKYQGEKAKVTFATEYLPGESTPTSIISQIHQNVQFDDRGRTMSQATVRFHHLGAKYLTFSLPGQADLWSVLLEGKGVKPIEKDGRYRISLADFNRPQGTLVITYVRPQESDGLAATMTSPLPTFSVPVLASSQTVHLADHYPVVTFGGTMEGTSPPHQLLAVGTFRWLKKRSRQVVYLLAVLAAIAVAVYLLYLAVQTWGWGGALKPVAAVAGVLLVISLFSYTFIGKSYYKKSRISDEMSKAPAKKMQNSVGSTSRGPAAGGEMDEGRTRPGQSRRDLDRLSRPKKRWRGRRNDAKPAPNAPEEPSVERTEKKKSPSRLSKSEENLSSRTEKPADKLAGKGGKNNFGDNQKRPDDREKEAFDNNKDTDLAGQKRGKKQQDGKATSSKVDLAQLFPNQVKVRGLKSLPLAPQMEGQSYHFRRSSGPGTVEVKVYRGSFLYPILFALALFTFLGGLFIGPAHRPTRMAFIFLAALLSTGAGLFGGPVYVPFANAIFLGAAALLAVGFIPGLARLISARLMGKVAALFLVALLALPGAVWAQEKKEEKVEKHRVYIPYHPGKTLSDKKVFISLEKYFQLLRDSRKKPSTQSENKTPALLVEAHYKGKIESGKLQVQGHLTFDLPRKEGVFFPLSLSGAQLNKALVDGRDTPFYVRDNQFYLPLQGPGQVKAVIDVQTYSRQNRFQLVLPRTGAATLEISHSLDGREISINGRTDVDWTKKGNTYQTKIHLGHVRTLVLTTQSSTFQPRTVSPRTRVAQKSMVYLQPRYLICRSQWEFHHLQTRAELDIDERYKILQVSGRRQGRSQLDTLTWKRQGKTVVVELKEPATKSYTLQVVGHYRFGKTPVFPPMKARAPLLRPTKIGFFAPKELDLQINHQGRYGRCDPAEFQWKARFAFTSRFAGEVPLVVKRKEAALEQTVQILLYVDESRTQGEAVLRVRSTNLPVYGLTLHVDPSFRITGAARATGLRDSYALGKGKHFLSFGQPITKVWRTIRLSGEILSRQGKLALPRIYLPQVDFGGTTPITIAVYRRPEWEVAVGKAPGLNLLDLGRFKPWSTVRRGYVSALGLTTSKETYQGHLAIRPIAPQLRHTHVVATEVAPHGMVTSGHWEIDVKKAPLEEVELWIPSSARSSFQVSGHSYRLQSQGEKSPWISAFVRLSSRRLGKRTISYTYTTSLPVADRFYLPVAQLPKGTVATTYLGLSLREEGYSIATKDIRDWERINYAPTSVKWPQSTSSPQFIFRKKGSKTVLPLVRRQEKAAETGAKALVSAAKITVHLDDRGGVLARADYRVRNQSRQFLEVLLPTGAQLWGAYVEGKIVQPSLAKPDHYLIPIPKRSQGDLSFAVQVFYRTEGPDDWTNFSSSNLPLPEIGGGVTVDRTFVALHVSNQFHYRLLDETNMESAVKGEGFLNEASQISQEFRQIMSVSKETGYQTRDQLHRQQRLLTNQSRLLGELEKNIHRARKFNSTPKGDEALKKRIYKNNLQLKDLSQQLQFYQQRVQSLRKKISRARREISRDGKGRPRHHRTRRPKGSPMEYDQEGWKWTQLAGIKLSLQWPEAQVSTRDEAPSIPPVKGDQAQKVGPRFFPAPPENSQVFYLQKVGGNPEVRLQVYTQKTGQSLHLLLGLVASILLLICAFQRGYLNFQVSWREKGLHGLATALLVVLFAISLTSYLAAVLLLLVALIDLAYRSRISVMNK